ncbi:Phosphatase YidA [Hordeum vulgare]|nr:Phosphatase YidA [Hordeum vulgare]
MVHADDMLITHDVTFYVRCAYSLLSSADEFDPQDDCIWSSRATIKVNIFVWLLFRDRLNTKANLHRKTIAPDSLFLRCAHHLGDASHLALSCPRWSRCSISLDFTRPRISTAFGTPSP